MCEALHSASPEECLGATDLVAAAFPPAALSLPAAAAPGGRNCALRMNLISSPGAVEITSVWVLTISTGKFDERDVKGAELATHLARHKLQVELVQLPAADIDVANAILSHAADSGADLIVMGGYGHSRIREFALGGATRGILESMTVPTLMSH